MRYPTARRCRLFVIGLAAAFLATGAVGCSSDSKSAERSSSAAVAAATVAGTKVPVAQIVTDLRAEVTAGKKGKAQTDPSSPLASPKAKAPGTYTPAASAAALTNRILYELYGQQLRSHGAKVVAIDKDRARQSLCADATSRQAPTGTSCPPLAAYPAAYRTFQLSLRERGLAFGKILYGRVFDTVKRTEPKLLREACLNVVQVADKTVSADVLKKAKSGATLADASKAATAAGKASALQSRCLFTVDVPPSIAKAKQRAVLPFAAQSAIGVVEVTSFKTATKAEFATDPPQSATSVQKLLKAEVDRSIRKVKVSVNRKYGRWDQSQLVVVAPPSKATTTTTTAVAPTTTGPSTTTKPTTAP